MKDPCVVVSLRQRSEVFREIGRTETIRDSTDPQFAAIITLDYCFNEVWCYFFSQEN